MMRALFSARRAGMALAAAALMAAAPASQADLFVGTPLDVEHQAMTASLADLGLRMLKNGKVGAAGQIVSPVSLAAALGLVHAGAAGRAAQELSALMAPLTAQDRALQHDLPALLALLQADTPELTSANRLWLQATIAPTLPESYTATARQRYAADAATVNFAQPQDARKTINDWAAERTAQRIEQLLPESAVTAGTRMVLTNAMHFKAPWATAFNPAATAEKPFWTDAQTSRSVPTMIQRATVRRARTQEADMIAVPFLEGRFSMRFFMPPAANAHGDLLQTLTGPKIAWLSSAGFPVTCNLEIPKFKIAPASVPLKKMLQDLGVRTVFTPQADFTPLLGDRAKDVALDDVYHAAGIAVEEAGVEAVAATAAVGVLKSMARPDPVENCQINRPFLFTITHVATGTPVFMGQVMQP